MRTINDGVIRNFIEISEMYSNDFTVVEIINIDYSIGEETGRILGLCNNFEEAWDKSSSFDTLHTTVITGLNKMSTLGGFV